MGSIFGGYHVAVSGMKVNQTGLNITSNNISNVSTAGYTRQRAINEECCNQQGLGTGSDVEEIKRMRNIFLDGTYRQIKSTAGYWEVKSSNLESIEAALNEFTADDGTSDNGLQQTLQEFLDGWEELSKDPGSLTARQTVVEYGEVLIETFAELDNQLQQMQEDLCSSCKQVVARINSIAKEVADLNSQIVEAEITGAEASDFRDQRDSLLDELSALTNITASEKNNGAVDVSIGGVSLIYGTNKFHTLTVRGDGSEPYPLQVQWVGLEREANITDGKIKAYLEDAALSDLESITTADIPVNFSADSGSSPDNLRQGLNNLLTTIALQLNALHSTGTGLDGTSGIDFFVVIDDSKPLSIDNMQVNPELDDLNKLAASTDGEEGDNTLAQQICQLAEEEYFQYDNLTMDYEDFYGSLVSWLGTAGSNAGSFAENQSNLLQQVETQRQEISSVSLDEEMAQMLVYQKAYSASARLLKTLDALVENLLYELG